ncbi:MAG TPA: TOBE domain-containing protein, partial [Solirubrobacterales bacterium]|nr:TOBE domain-containing protein [Solirubrobacterales bacterium]
VTMAVRPEKVSLADEPAVRELPASANACKGSVEELIYVGDATRYRVAVGADGVVTVKVQNRLAARAYRTGEPVLLAWNPAETRLFPEPSHAA